MICVSLKNEMYQIANLTGYTTLLSLLRNFEN